MRKMRKLLKISIVGLVIVGVVALLAGCAPAAPVEEEGEEIELIPVGLSFGWTGATASFNAPCGEAAKAYYAWMNDEGPDGEGGFTYIGPDGKEHRAKYDAMWADNGFLVGRSMTILTRFAEKGVALMYNG